MEPGWSIPAALQEGGTMQFERRDLVNMLHSASPASGGTSFVILLISPDKGMIWQFVREQHYHLVEEHFPF